MDDRKKELLKEIVENYVKTVKPVGSKSLCKKLNCSSATIRNEMAVLENMGYIEKNHISSGRIPSELGYRYYVENLMKPKDLTGEDMLKLQTIFSNTELQVSDAVTKCMEIISDLTNYTSVVLGKNSNDNLLQQINIITLAPNKVVAIVCTDKGIVENKQFMLPIDTDVSEIVRTSEMINKMLVGTPINKVAEKLEFEIKPVIAKHIKNYETVYNIFYDAFNDFLLHNTNIHVSGRVNLLKEPEYDNTEDIKRIASKLEDESFKEMVSSIDGNEELQIYIGEETNFDDNVTVIKRKYKSGGEEGTIAIIGPKRMEYERVVSLLNYMVDKIEGK
ncbi:MAG: heat-inducible transcription repressor HrcA [Bacilli bacterium]|nr:heat-inducible transcription repressor HrcA [Bacilli bacterium]